MRILVSGGPTHEFLDDVRYLGNPSTGAMAIEIALAAQRADHEPHLVLGPTHLSSPEGVPTVRVTSALEMRDAMITAFKASDAVVMSAAVSDYRPANRHKGKWKKGPDTLHLELIKNPDILQELGIMASGRPVVGFALESSGRDDALAYARDKLRRKGCSLIVLNGPGSLGAAGGDHVVLIGPNEERVLGNIPKCTVAEHLITFLEEFGSDAGADSGDEPKRGSPAG